MRLSTTGTVVAVSVGRGVAVSVGAGVSVGKGVAVLVGTGVEVSRGFAVSVETTTVADAWGAQAAITKQSTNNLVKIFLNVNFSMVMKLSDLL